MMSNYITLNMRPPLSMYKCKNVNEIKKKMCSGENIQYWHSQVNAESTVHVPKPN